MTKDTNKQKALRVIRYLQENIEGLKELSKGCRGTIAGVPIIITAYKNQVYWFIRTNTLIHEGLRKSVFEESFQIIGHEPELNHLLLAIDKSNKTPHKQAMTLDGKCMINYKYETTGMAIQGVSASPYSYPKQTGWSSLDYDLTKTVQENLESNPELTNYLINLFGL